MQIRRREPTVAAGARAWHHATHAAVCDVLEPWAHGTVVRATRFWIAADDDDRPKELYARLGFVPAWTAMEFLRLP